MNTRVDVIINEPILFIRRIYSISLRVFYPIVILSFHLENNYLITLVTMLGFRLSFIFYFLKEGIAWPIPRKIAMQYIEMDPAGC